MNPKASTGRCRPSSTDRPSLRRRKESTCLPPARRSDSSTSLRLYPNIKQIRNVAGNERLKDPKIHKQTYTMGIPTERSVRRPPSEFMKKGRGLQLLERKIRKTRADSMPM